MSNIYQLTRKRRKNNNRSKDTLLVSYDAYKGLNTKHERLLRDHENLHLAYELLLRDFEDLYKNSLTKNET